jgi:hypothetical protein
MLLNSLKGMRSRNPSASTWQPKHSQGTVRLFPVTPAGPAVLLAGLCRGCADEPSVRTSREEIRARPPSINPVGYSLLHEPISGNAGVAPAVVAALSAPGSFSLGHRGLLRHRCCWPGAALSTPSSMLPQTILLVFVDRRPRMLPARRVL